MEPLHSQLVGALVGLTRAISGNDAPDSAGPVMLSALTDLPTAGPDALLAHIDAVHQQKDLISPGCKWCAQPCGRTDDYDLSALAAAPEDVRRAKEELLAALVALAPLVSAAREEGGDVGEAVDLLCRGLFALGEDWEADFLRSVTQQARRLMDQDN